MYRSVRAAAPDAVPDAAGPGLVTIRAMEKAGLQARFIQGQRVTDDETVEVTK